MHFRTLSLLLFALQVTVLAAAFLGVFDLRLGLVWRRTGHVVQRNTVRGHPPCAHRGGEQGDLVARREDLSAQVVIVQALHPGLAMSGTAMNYGYFRAGTTS